MPEPDYTLLDRQEILEAMFYPRRDWTVPPRGASDHAVPVDEDVFIVCRFYPHSPQAPSIIYFHGNGEVACEYDDVAPIYLASGINLFVADYRGYGASTGRPSFSTLVSDSDQVFLFFREFLARVGYAKRLYVMGRSLGATPALELAARSPEHLKGLILESGAGGLGGWSRWMRPGEDVAPWEELQKRHQQKLSHITLPLLTIHGEWDALIPVERALELREALNSRQKELVVIPQAGHNDLFYRGMEQYMEAVRAFVKG
ncbi:MAG: alpha/beta hydrolase [Dehalococcoidia bacterium]|nr:alpha/beta hydrolase [Dehalococcoidia bacterium]